MEKNLLKNGKIIYPDKLKINLKLKVGIIGSGKISLEYIKVIKHDRLPKKVLLNQLRKSSLLLLLSTPNFVTLAGKIFDYLTTNKPILLYQNDRPKSAGS